MTSVLTANHSRLNRFFPFITLLGLVGFLLVVWPVQAQRTVPYAEYLAMIGRLRGEVQTAGNEGGDNCVNRLQQVATELEGVTAVQLPDGSLMPVNHQGVRVAWSGFCQAVEAEAYLGGICPVLTCPTTGVTIPPGDQGAVPSLSDTANNQPNSPNGIPAFDPGQPGSEQPLPGQQPGDLPAPNAPEQSPGDAAQSENAASSPTNTDGQPPPGSDLGEPAPGTEEQPGETGAEQPGGEASSDQEQPGETGSQSGEAGETTGSETADTTGETAETASDTPGQPDSGANPGSQPAPSQPDSNRPEAPGLPSDLTVPTTETNWLLWIVAITGVLLVVVSLLIIRARRNAKKRGQAAKRKRNPQESTPVQAIDEGRHSLAEGDYRTAVRQLFLAALLILDERAILHFDPTLTNYELLDQAQIQPGLLLLLKPIIKTFERVWYGFESLETADYESLVQRIESLKQHSTPAPVSVPVKLGGET